MPQKTKPKQKRVRFNLYLDADQKQRLEELSEKSRITASDYIREGIELVLERYGFGKKGAKK